MLSSTELPEQMMVAEIVSFQLRMGDVALVRPLKSLGGEGEMDYRLLFMHLSQHVAMELGKGVLPQDGLASNKH
jgi:hypothetical protein